MEIPFLHNPAQFPWRSDAALAAGRLGEQADARRLADEELRLALQFGAPRSIGVPLRTRGLVVGGEKGLEPLRAAVAALEGSPSELELCRALVDLGAAVRRQGRRSEAREPLRRALDMARRLGTRALERRAGEELLASGARPRRRDLSGPDSLTPSERRVAALAAGVMTNREIAQELFVTVKAVQWHLRNIYRKLDIASREGLGTALAG